MPLKSPEHLPLPLRKVPCALFRIFEAMEPLEEQATDAKCLVPFQRFRTELQRAATELGKKSPQTHRLDFFVHEVADAVPDVLRRFTLIDPARTALPPIAAQIREALKAVNCEACAGVDRVCRGSKLVDDDVVAARGACLEPFNRIFEFARTATLQCYEQYSSVAAQHLRAVEVYLSTDVLKKEPNLVLCRRINGATTYHDEGTQQASEVGLHFDRSTLDTWSVRTIPYLFFHELVCHAWQGIVSRNQPVARSLSDTTSPDDYFAEGWMDHVAIRILELAQRGTFETHPALKFAPCPQLRLQHVAQGRDVSGERGDADSYYFRQAEEDLDDDESLRRAAIYHGQRAASWFEQQLDRQDLSGEGVDLFLKLSFDLNVEARIADQRLGFVLKMYEQLQGGREPEQHVADAIHNYISHRNLWTFINSIL
jgi:hypothetical protein